MPATFFSLLPKLIPGVSFSTTTQEIPLGPFPPVRHITMYTSVSSSTDEGLQQDKHSESDTSTLYHNLLFHISYSKEMNKISALDPLRTSWSPSNFALVSNEAASLPLPET